MTTSLRTNALASLIGRGIVVVAGAASVPALLEFSGQEALGLAGLFLLLQAALAFLDPGLSIAATRAVAGAAHVGDDAALRSTLSAMQWMYWSIGAVLAALAVPGALWAAPHWLQPEQLSLDELRLSSLFIGFAVALTWCSSIYAGILRGLELHVRLNVARSIIAIARSVAAIGLLWQGQAITSYFAVYAAAAFVDLAMLYKWSKSTTGSMLRLEGLDVRQVRRVITMSLSVNVLTMVGAVQTYGDKLIISKSLPLSSLGVYTAAATAASLTVYGSYALFDAVFSRYSRNVQLEAWTSLAHDYRRTVRAAMLLAYMPALPLIFFGEELLLAWTRSADVASAGRVPLALLALGYVVHVAGASSYQLAVAAGRAEILVRTAVLMTCVCFAAWLALVPPFEMIGAAAVWFVVQSVLAAFYAVRVHQLFLKRELNGAVRDIVRLTLVGVTVFALARVGAAFISPIVALAAAIITFAGIGAAAAGARSTSRTMLS